MNCLLDGWGTYEAEGRWVERVNAGIIFKVHEIKSYTHISFFGHSFYQPQKVSFVLNGVKNDTIIMSNMWQKYILPLKGLKKNVNTLRISFEKGFTPTLLDKNSTDLRQLFCRFAYFRIPTS